MWMIDDESLARFKGGLDECFKVAVVAGILAVTITGLGFIDVV